MVPEGKGNVVINRHVADQGGVLKNEADLGPKSLQDFLGGSA
jgi:hypothetical protein